MSEKYKSKIKLTPLQNKVIYCLQNGWELITSNEVKGAWVGTKEKQFYINGGVFWNLYNKGLIYQGHEKDHFSYLLTGIGDNIKTRPVEI